MKARDVGALVKRDREYCANLWLTTCTAQEAEALALRVFPAGTLPGYQFTEDELEVIGKTDGHPRCGLFTPRELAIIKQLVWQTAEMDNRVLDAVTIAATERQGATFSQ